MITVTLQQIKNAEPCTIGWKKVLKANDGKGADMNKSFPLSSILDSNDLDDTLWLVENVRELAKHEKIWREFACFCAMQNIDKIKPYCSGGDYNLIVEYLTTQDEGLRLVAGAAARAAGAAARAAWDAAGAAARAAGAAAGDAARVAARAAWDAAWVAARAAGDAAWDAAWVAARAAGDAAWDAGAAGAAAWDAAGTAARAAARADQVTKLRELLTGDTKCNYL